MPLKWKLAKYSHDNSLDFKFIPHSSVGSAAILARGQQVLHQRWISGMCNMYASAKCKYGYPLWLWHPGEMSLETQSKGISCPTKRTYALQELKKKVQDHIDIKSTRKDVSVMYYYSIKLGKRLEIRLESHIASTLQTIHRTMAVTQRRPSLGCQLTSKRMWNLTGQTTY